MDCVILAIQMYSHSIEIEILSNSLLWRLQSKIEVADFSVPWKENHTWSYCDINIEHSIFKFQFQESTLGSLFEGLVDGKFYVALGDPIIHCRVAYARLRSMGDFPGVA